MVQGTVQQLAEDSGKSVEHLLGQMAEAGLPHTEAEQLVSYEDKQMLFAYLHGESGQETPRQITLKRTTRSKLKASGAQGKKTVNVEVRKRRTYVRREQEEQAAGVASPAEAEFAPEPPAADASAAGAALPAEAASAETDAETLRRQATAKRQQTEAEEAAARTAALAARETQQAQRQATATARQDGGKPADAREAKPRRLHQAPKQEAERYGKKAKGRSDRPAEHTRGKQRGHNLSLNEIAAAEAGAVRRRSGRKKPMAKTHEEHSRHGFEMPTERQLFEVELGDVIEVGELAAQMSVKSSVVIKELLKLGIAATINQVIDQDTAVLVIEELGHSYRIVSEDMLEENLEHSLSLQAGKAEPRAPVVTVMGHVDHGKTSLLDYIRKARVAAGEAGGITQHIGAYHVETAHGMISFLDTPGHAAFTAMRARGAKSTDIVILVVAADDGVMPQTEEAVQHARAAGVPIIVAINKMDKDGADPERVRKELSAREVVAEDWGGDTQFIEVSAETGQGVDELLDAVLLQAEILELKAPRDVPARGLVIESRLDRGRGPVASLLVQFGTLRAGDIVLAGLQYGRVRAMLDENGEPSEQAGPSIPVEIMGLDGTPDAGDQFAVVESEKQARELADFRQEKTRDTRLQRQHAARLDNLFDDMTATGGKALNVVIKADVRGSLEAVQSALLELGNEEVTVNIVSVGVGGIAETDAALALTTNAVIFGFNVRADNAARKLVEEGQLDMRYYSVIYHLIDDVKQALTGMLSPELHEDIVGVAAVREVFYSPKFGQVAGCMVIEGTVYCSKSIRVLREDVVVYEGELESLRRFKEDANEVRNGMECGIGVKNYTDVKVGDKIEVYDVKEIARSL